MPADYIVNNVGPIAHLPTRIIHGRFDQVCPLTQASRLHSALETAGARDVQFIKTTAGHSALEQENALALAAMIERLPTIA